MTTLSTRLGLKKSTTADAYRIAEYADNWARLDDHPGVYVCTSATRPSTWGTDQAGMLISETDTNLVWRWTGTVWTRQAPAGLLSTASSDMTQVTTSTTLADAIGVIAQVPAGGRSVLVVVDAPRVYSTTGVTRLALYRSGTELQSWLQRGGTGGTAEDLPSPIEHTYLDTPSAGGQYYSLRFAAEPGFGGACTIAATATNKINLSVVEV